MLNLIEKKNGTDEDNIPVLYYIRTNQTTYSFKKGRDIDTHTKNPTH